MNSFLSNVLFTIAGIVLAIIWDWLKDKYRFRRELKENNRIDLSGDWYAAWQTSVNSQEVINTEEIRIQQRGGVVKIWNKAKSPENPIAGYKWTGHLQLFQGRDLMGHYFSNKEEQNTNKGIVYFCYQSAKKELIGRWVGNSYDGPLLSGYAVICKRKEDAVNTLREVLQAHPSRVPILSLSMS